MGKGKPHGINAARKLRLNRRKKKWADQKYIKSHSGSAKTNPLGVAPCASGILLRRLLLKPNSQTPPLESA